MRKICLVLCLIVVYSMAFTGCGHKHKWNDATYNTPKTCTSCGEIEGESIKDQVESEMSSGDYEFAHSWAALARMTKDNSKDAISETYDYMLTAKSHYNKAYELCGNYSELSELKKNIKKILDAMPTSAPTFTDAGLERYMNAWTDAMNLWGELRNKN